MRFFPLVVCLFVLSLCGCSRKITQSTESVKHDSTHTSVKISYQDTLVTIPGDSVCIDTVLSVINGKVADIKPVTKKSKQASVTVAVTNGVLQADADCDSLQVKLQNQIIETDYYRSLWENVKQIQYIPTPYVPFLWKLFGYLGIGAFIFCVSMIVYYFTFRNKI
jgi:hypothetical protein